MQCNVKCRLPEEDAILKEPPPYESPPHCIFFYKFSKKVNNAIATYRVGKKSLITHFFLHGSLLG